MSLVLKEEGKKKDKRTSRDHYDPSILLEKETCYGFCTGCWRERGGRRLGKK